MTGEPKSSLGRVISALAGRWWFWALLLAFMWSVPLVKSLSSELPPPLAGYDREPLQLSLRTEADEDVSLRDLGGYLLLVGELRLSDAEQASKAVDRLNEIRDRLRGLGSAVVHLLLVEGGGRGELAALVEERKIRKPQHVFLFDEGGAAWRELVGAEGSGPDAAYLLLDRHGRLRGAYPDVPEEIDRMVREAGQLANWPGQDPPPGEPVRG